MRPTFFLFIALSEYRAGWIPELWKRQLADSTEETRVDLGDPSSVPNVARLFFFSFFSLSGWYRRREKAEAIVISTRLKDTRAT
jgi:hypothetical protein